MTAIGENGRLGPGESWRRAMDRVAELHARGARRRYRVRGRQVEPGWWAYEAVKATPLVSPEAVPGTAKVSSMTRKRIAAWSAQLPRCAQRARSLHGGDSKVAWPSRGMAWEVANTLGHHAYRCELPAPAIGEHWHTSRARRKRRAR